MAINAYDEDKEIEIPVQHLEKFEILKKSEDFFVTDDSEFESVPAEQRLNRIIESLSLDCLNQKEKEHFLRLIVDFQEIFYLPGDLLPATDVLHFPIPTTDNVTSFV